MNSAAVLDVANQQDALVFEVISKLFIHGVQVKECLGGVIARAVASVDYVYRLAGGGANHFACFFVKIGVGVAQHNHITIVRQGADRVQITFAFLYAGCVWVKVNDLPAHFLHGALKRKRSSGAGLKKGLAQYFVFGVHGFWIQRHFATEVKQGIDAFGCPVYLRHCILWGFVFIFYFIQFKST